MNRAVDPYLEAQCGTAGFLNLSSIKDVEVLVCVP
jgi:hypothetical protein